MNDVNVSSESISYLNALPLSPDERAEVITHCDYLSEEWGVIVCEIVLRAVLAVCPRHAQYAEGIRPDFEESFASLAALGIENVDEDAEFYMIPMED